MQHQKKVVQENCIGFTGSKRLDIKIAARKYLKYFYNRENGNYLRNHFNVDVSNKSCRYDCPRTATISLYRQTLHSLIPWPSPDSVAVGKTTRTSQLSLTPNPGDPSRPK